MTESRSFAPHIASYVLAAVLPTAIAAIAAVVAAGAAVPDGRADSPLEPVVQAERVRSASERLGRAPLSDVAFREELSRLGTEVRDPAETQAYDTVDRASAELLRASLTGDRSEAPREAFGRSIDAFVLQARRTAERDRLDGVRAAQRRQRVIVLVAIGSLLAAAGLSVLIARRSARALVLARQASERRERFLGEAVRELAGPLGSVNDALTELDSRPAMAMEARSSLRSARMAVTRLSNMLQETGEAAGLSTGGVRLQRERVDLGLLARAIAARATSGPTSLPVEVEVRGRAIGDWDRVRIEEVLTHLIGNATRFGHGRRVRVVVSGGDPVRLVVRDHGQGIPRDRQAHLFDGFGAPHARGGLGLGLFIVQRIVEAHGGTIRVESEPGLGSTFTVELPARPLPPRPPRRWTTVVRPQRI